MVRKEEKKISANWSADGYSMTVNSIVHLTVSTPYKENAREQMNVYVQEVWTMSNDGESIFVHTKAKADQLGEERTWTTVLDKANF